MTARTDRRSRTTLGVERGFQIMVGEMSDEDVRTDTRTNVTGSAVKRRDFLRGIGLAAGGAAGAAVVAAAPAVAGEGESASPSGYRETDHVRTVYRTARF